MLGAAVMVFVIAFNFRVLSHKIVEAEANAIAEIIKAGLTSHMKAGIMEKRDYFLNEISSVNEVRRISIVRSSAVDRQFGVGRFEKEMDGLSNEVFQSGQPKFIVNEFSSTPTIRAIIPYIASSKGGLNCLNCHQVAEGVVLGVVDIELDVTQYRNMASWIMAVLVIFSLVFTALIVRNTLRTVDVHVKEPLENLVERARVAYQRQQPVSTDSFQSLEFESVANEINLFNADIIANQEQIEQMNSNLISLNDEIEDTLRETVFTMGVIEEKRSKETNNHTKRVTEYSRLLASQCGLSEPEIELIVSAAPLHDVGKLGIPDRILLKPGKLTPDEFEVMRNHASIGYAMLVHSKRDILKAAAIIAYQHHEKWDGSGYPQGLKGEEIHLYGRIVALADVFDALATRRTYKESWSIERIIDWFEAERGRHFDPQLVDILFETMDEFIAIGEQYGTNGEDDNPRPGDVDFVAEGI